MSNDNLNLQPVPRGFYAWNSLHAGSFLLFMESLNDHYKFIFLPGPSYMNLAFETFTKCIKSNTLELVEQLPEDVYADTVSFAKQNC